MLHAPTLPLGAADCEAAGSGWLVQPINAWSSLAYTVVGVVLILSASQATPGERSVRMPFGILMAATGVGSFLYHGPQPDAAEFAHDITFLAMLWFLILMNPASPYGVRRRYAWIALGTVAAAGSAILIVVPSSANVLTGVSLAALVASDLLVRRVGGVEGQWYAAALLLFGASLVFNLLGRSGSVTCDPDSVIQFHALWHLFSAAALGAYFNATNIPRNQEPPP